MSACTFFGHRRYSGTMRQKIRSEIVDLIENNNVDLFYVGANGNFDREVAIELREIKKIYPFIKYYVVLSYFPSESDKLNIDENLPTLLPDGIENVLPKFAIVWRNNWMIKRSDYVIAFAERIGGAMNFARIAESKGKIVKRI